MEIEIGELEWNVENVDHIKRHAVSQYEVEEACLNQIAMLSGHKGRQMLFGKTSAARYLTVILMKKASFVYYVVTARDTSKKERKYVYDQENK